MIVSGPYEFLADDPFRYGIHAPEDRRGLLPPVADAKIALEAHNLLKVDLGWLSGKSSAWLRTGAGSIPLNYAAIGKEPLVRVLDTPAGKIGLVLFPEGRQPGRGPAAATVLRVLEAGKQLAGRVRLVIGVSPWGYRAEKDFVKKAQGIYACLLGGGEGIGFGYSLKESAEVLWLRPDSQGRAVNILEFLELPGFDAKPRWIEGETFRAYLQFLDESFPSDPAMETIIGKQVQ